MVIETATLHAGTCTRSRVITYELYSSSWIRGAMHVEDRVEYNSGHRDVHSACRLMHKGRVITYFLDSSSWIHGAMHAE